MAHKLVEKQLELFVEYHHYEPTFDELPFDFEVYPGKVLEDYISYNFD
jgi:hypothetical protein